MIILTSDWFSGVKLSEKFGEMKEALTWLSVIAKKWQVIYWPLIGPGGSRDLNTGL